MLPILGSKNKVDDFVQKVCVKSCNILLTDDNCKGIEYDKIFDSINYNSNLLNKLDDNDVRKKCLKSTKWC